MIICTFSFVPQDNAQSTAPSGDDRAELSIDKTWLAFIKAGAINSLNSCNEMGFKSEKLPVASSPRWGHKFSGCDTRGIKEQNYHATTVLMDPGREGGISDRAATSVGPCR